jgi:hypothetical protein
MIVGSGGLMAVIMVMMMGQFATQAVPARGHAVCA